MSQNQKGGIILEFQKCITNLGKVMVLFEKKGSDTDKMFWDTFKFWMK